MKYGGFGYLFDLVSLQSETPSQVNVFTIHEVVLVEEGITHVLPEQTRAPGRKKTLFVRLEGPPDISRRKADGAAPFVPRIRSALIPNKGAQGNRTVRSLGGRP